MAAKPTMLTAEGLKNLEAELNQVRSYAIQLTEDYNEVVAMCKEQQEILNSLADI